jgi:hypothetical protein
MDWLGEFWRRLSFLWNGRRIDRDLEEEIRFHLDMKARAAAESGSPGPDAQSAARRAAHLQFGGATLWREIARDAWGWGVVRLVLRDAILMIVAGMAIGVPAAIAGARYIRSQLFGLRPADPLTLTLACLALAAVALLAGYLPARRASRVNPVTALRYE